jgi:hypothetical protein
MFHTWDTICIISNGDPHIARIYSLVFSAIIVRETENLICRYWIFTFCAFLCRHGVKQQLNCWADGVPMITQCPIGQTTTLPSGSTSMHGSSELFTLWWHMLMSPFRGTIHGAFIIQPKTWGLEQFLTNSFALSTNLWAEVLLWFNFIRQGSGGRWIFKMHR